MKVVIDEKEYDRLLEVERKYKEHLEKPIPQLSQSGKGSCRCGRLNLEQKNIPLNEIITRNVEQQAVESPIPDVLPAITVPRDSPTSTSEPRPNPTASEQQQQQKSATEKTKNKYPNGPGEDSKDEKELEELGKAKFVHPWYYIGPPHQD